MGIKKAEFIFMSNDVSKIIKFHEENFKGKVIHKMAGLFTEIDTLYVMDVKINTHVVRNNISMM